ncbi:nucleotide exchange factor GrpE [uncultured Bacteroides sp.]|uniref:nucleotide exchange factor GrpE n=1 Tax=uncultured Bacteroides sp. TaxID=162156 RepID=UPI002AABC8FD|nr:nucleotide exchange factor GrpE [uncultured Bacteroides sp.]
MDPKKKETSKKEEELVDNIQEAAQENCETAQENETTQETPSQEEEVLTPEQALTKQLEEANAKIEDQNDKYLRLSAEFDNYRKRTMKEKAELIKNGGEKSISSILPVIDDMERAVKMMETSTDVAAVREGMELIFNKFVSILGQNGVQAIESKECDFNTDFHEAIATIPAPAEELKGKILDCVQTGYLLNGKVIRHAKVVVGE